MFLTIAMLLSDIHLGNSHIYVCVFSEFETEKKIFVNSFPWLFPGGIGDIWDNERGSPVDIRVWCKHLLKYYDGRFQRDQLFSLYAFNMIQRHDNNRGGNFFVNSPNFVGKEPPSVEDLKRDVANGNTKYISVLQYFSASKIRGSDAFWRGKSEELKTWIDYHVAEKHGPPTMFVTFSCAENWWPDLMRLLCQMERKCGNEEQAKAIESNDATAIAKSAKRYPLLVNQFFMKRANLFMTTFAKKALGIKYYWARVEFEPGRGQIHLHLLGIGENRTYLLDYYRAKTPEEKTRVINNYATTQLGMTADLDISDDTSKKIDTSPLSKTALRIRFCECTDPMMDIRSLAEDCMCHKCNGYCLVEGRKKEQPRECRSGFGVEATYSKKDTEGMELREEPIITKSKRGVTMLQMKRTKSRRLNQLSVPMLRAWRANCDIKLLLYNSNPLYPDIAEIESVTRYVVAYTSKKSHTLKSEREQIQNIIMRSEGYIYFLVV